MLAGQTGYNHRLCVRNGEKYTHLTPVQLQSLVLIQGTDAVGLQLLYTPQRSRH
jgi:hypothetical protein